MRELVMVPTANKREAFGVYCPVCKSGTNETTFWGFDKTVAMHLRGTGHQMVYVRLVTDDEKGN